MIQSKTKCVGCDKVLNKNEIALSNKLLNVKTEGYYCIQCLAEYLDCSQDDLKIKIQEFKEHGCTQFI